MGEPSKEKADGVRSVMGDKTCNLCAETGYIPHHAYCPNRFAKVTTDPTIESFHRFQQETRETMQKAIDERARGQEPPPYSDMPAMVFHEGPTSPPPCAMGATIHGVDYVFAPASEVAALRDNLTATQERCNNLLREKRNGPGAIRVKRLTATAKIPTRAHDGDSGLDLHADITTPLTIRAGDRAAISTGIAVSVPKGYEAQVRPRSGLARKHGVATFLGTIDAGYIGDIGVTLLNSGRESFTVRPGDRIAQLVVMPVVLCDLVEVDDLEETERGAAGFGSTGVGAKP